MKLIRLGRTEYFTMVDDSDYVFLMQWKWHRNIQGYAQTRIHPGDVLFLLHRVIADAMDGLEVDHIDGNPLNNQSSNLRLATRKQNCANTRKRHGAYTSQYKGVSWSKRQKHWRAEIRVSGKLEFLGHFDDPVLAALAYNRRAIETRGDYAKVNFIHANTDT